MSWEVGARRGWKPPWVPSQEGGSKTALEELVEDAREQRERRPSGERPGWRGANLRGELTEFGSGELPSPPSQEHALARAAIVTSYVTKPLQLLRRNRARRANAATAGSGAATGLGRFFGDTVEVVDASPTARTEGENSAQGLDRTASPSPELFPSLPGAADGSPNVDSIPKREQAHSIGDRLSFLSIDARQTPQSVAVDTAATAAETATATE
jgi:hypothetical protein